MDIKEIDLRRSDFEAMHPVAKLFNFDHEKLTYFGDAYDDAKRLNDLWSTWCACVGLLYLETNTAKAQAVPEGFVLVSAEQMSQWGHMANCAQEYGCPECYESRGYAHSLACEINAYFNVGEAKEPAND